MNLMRLIDRALAPIPWREGENIPWHDPGFSQRMLKEHLSQTHDWASRRQAIIEKQVAWLHRHILGSTTGTVLDLACGPGLYTAQLAALGHRCTGIDYAPASIAHAIEQAERAGALIDYREADLRTSPFGANYDLILLCFGELNVFPKPTAATLLRRAAEALTPSGKLLLEVHRPSAVRQMGERPPKWSTHRAGLFSALPHVLLEECFWDEATAAATKRYHVIDAVTGATAHYAASYQAYRDDDYDALLRSAGLATVQRHPSLSGDPAPRSGPGAELMVLVGARR